MLIKFENEEFEYEKINNKPYFKASEVCKILGFANQSNAVKNHCDPKGILHQKTLTQGGEQTMVYIDEANLYALIFNVPVIKKKDSEERRAIKEKAERFKWFVFDEILPQIRKTGSYSFAKKLSPEEHAKREVQLQNSKIINAINYENGGVKAITEYCSVSCKKITNKKPFEWRKIGEEIGLKSSQRRSGKEVLRNVEGLKKYACALSVSDNLRAQGWDIDNASEAAKAGLEFFDKLLTMGVDVKM